MKKVLVTGSSGFIGRYAAAELARRGYDVIAPHSSELNLLDLAQTREFAWRTKATHLAHLAWYRGHGKIWSSPANAEWVTASANLFEAFLNAGGKKAFFAGSCAEYEWSGRPLDETATPIRPLSEYGRGKASLHEKINERVAAGDAEVIWGRIFFVYGPSEAETRLAPSILHPLLRGERAVVRCGDHWRDFLHVEDVARAIGRLLDAPPAGRSAALNIASGVAVNLGDFGKVLARLAGKEDMLTIEHAEATPDNPAKVVAKLNRLSAVGFVPKYSLEAGLKTFL